jgi:hypothetical protein
MSAHIRPRAPKTNAAIRAGVIAWWWMSSTVREREETSAAVARLFAEGHTETPCTSVCDDISLGLLVNCAAAKGHKTSVARVLAAAKTWDDVGFDCGDGLTARLSKASLCDPYRIEVTGPV